MAHAFALSGSNLISFDTTTPTTGTTIAITGVLGSETLVGIDVRPQNGLLYALGVNAAANTATLYTISTRTGVATAVGAASGIALTTDGVTPVDFPDPSVVGWAFDVNPAADRIRVVTDSGLNFRINPNTGTAVDGDNGGAAGSVTGMNPDGAVNGSGVSGIDAAAYTNDQPNNGNVTTLYTLDAVSNALFIQNPANSGTQTSGHTVTLNGNPLDFTSVNAFDIPAGVNAASSGAAVTTGSGFAVLNVGGTTGLYSINLVNGNATFLGTVLNGTTAVSGLAIQSDLGGIPAIALSADGSALVRFNTATPGTTTTQAINSAGLTVGEALVAIDFRPATGQLYGLGVDATANTATLYLIDPQTGAVTIVGVASQIGFVDGGGNPVDLPDPATAGYGFDFNPAVDRIRVTTSTGLNFRVNPITGAPVDGDLGGSAGSVVGINPDGNINGSSSGVSATAYTNSYGGTTATTLYTLDATLNALLIQNPANSGTETLVHGVTLGGSALDFTSINGFDIAPGVSVTTNGATASGFGFAALTVGGVTSLYEIDLATGAATDLGVIAGGAGGLAGLTLANAQSAPTITSDGAHTTANVAVAENTTAVTTVTAYDGDFDQVHFSISGGADAAKFAINATTGALSFIAAPDFEAPGDADADNSYVVQVTASDGSHSGSQTINVAVANVVEPINLTPGDDNFTAPAGASIVNGLAGRDTISFNFKLTDASISFVNGRIFVDGPGGSHSELTGFEVFKFTDGTVNQRDGSPLVDDLFYYAKYHDVWAAGVDADTHFNTFGWKEGRDPNAFFDTKGYLAQYTDVAAAGVNPLTHFDRFGFKEGRDPSTAFDTGDYLSHYPDVAANGVDPLAHFLTWGSEEGRLAFGDGVWG
jgi:hypothetical protein